MSWSDFPGLRARLVLLVLVAGLPAFAFAFNHLQAERRREMQVAERQAAQLAHLVSVEEQRAVSEARGLLVALSQAHQAEHPSEAACSALLRRIRSRYPGYANLGITDRLGNVLCSAVPLQAPVNVGDREYFRRAVAIRDFAIGGYMVGRITGRPSLTFAYPLIDERNEVTGVVYAALDLDSLNLLAADVRSRLPEGATLTELDENGTVVAQRPRIAGRLGKPFPDLAAVAPKLRRAESATFVRDADGERRLRTVTRVQGPLAAGNIYVLVEVPERVVFADLNADFAREIAALLATLFIVVLGAWAGASVLVLRPVRGLLAATEKLAGGDLDNRIGPRYRKAELGALERAFDRMADSLEAQQADRDRAAQALTKSETDYRSLVQNAPFGIYRSVPDGRFLMVNPRLVEMLGYDSEDDLMQRNLSKDIYVEAADRERLVAQALRHGQALGVDVRWKRKDGRPLLMRVSGRLVRGPSGEPACFEIFVEDETERRALEAQLAHSQRLEAVGRLAGGIAHDFNNILTVMVGYGQLLAERLDDADPRRSLLEEIRSAAVRAATLTRQLLAFSRKQVLEPRVLDLNAVVADTERLLHRLVGEDVDLRTKLASGLGYVRMDPGQLEQVIMNLAVNARDAMPEGGSLILETANADLAEPLSQGGVVMPAGSYVQLSVSDTGEGMDAETRAQIFEPFFTTKGPGKGTGLGLATVFGIVKQSGGFIWVYSHPGQGATFKIYLPRVVAQAEPPAPAPPAGPAPRGTETVLLVEDEAPLRALATEFLRDSGYTVVSAADPLVALQIASEGLGEVDLVLTDVILPGMTGLQLAQQLKAMRPAVKVLYMSGHSDEMIAERGHLPEGFFFLPKPFTRESLIRKAREVLDSGAGGGSPPPAVPVDRSAG